MCAEGQRRSKGATHRHYAKQVRNMNKAKRRGTWFSSVGWDTLVHEGPIAWFRWVFLDLDHHQDDCKWARLAKVVVR